MKVFVTGGAGFIGSAVCRLFVGELDATVLNVDNLTYAANLVSLRTIEKHPRYSFRQADVCDRRMTYRGIAGMEVHLFTWRELSKEIRSAGFRIEEVLPIDAVRSRSIVWPWLGHGLRAGGWIIFIGC